MDRRIFVKTAGAAGAAGLLGACGQGNSSAAPGEAGHYDQTFTWKMVTTWPRDFPGLGRGAARLAEMIGEMSNGRLTVKVYGGGELVPPLEVFSAVQQGTAEMGHGAAYYWRGKVKAGLLFTGIPFGLTATEIHGWLYYGGGNELYRKAYAPYGLVPFPAGNSGTQMGGWFKKKIESVADLDGLKMRIPGIGGEALQRAGGTSVNVPGGEVFTALQSGVVDAAEWVGPMNDLALGLHQAAPYYYYPGWQEPGSVLECIVNEAAWNSLPSDLKKIVEVACQAVTTDMYADFEASNGEALRTLVEDHGVELLAFPDDVLAELRGHTFDILDELAAEDAMVRETWDSFRAYMNTVRRWTDVSERYMLNHR
ncbi:TRAP transporter substrate-binding protein [Elongatibacter sediminis]|uniref:TRAP transporter substrate-binding protein n=1 Tax=Elongatibacter sediminis TaxID=3119006 RepID=A0AAW9RH17_9GAMM